MKSKETDKRISTILGSGYDMMCCVDPDGIFKGFQVSSMSFSVRGAMECVWEVNLRDSSGVFVCLSGDVDELDEISVMKCLLSCDEEKHSISVKAPESLYEALSCYNDMSDRLRSFLALKQPDFNVEKSGLFSLGALRSLVFDALLFDIDYADDDIRGIFYSYSLCFSYMSKEVVSCGMTAHAVLSSGVIDLHCDVDASGLRGKGVSLTARIGPDGRVVAKCTVDHNGVARPSLTVALQLAGMFDEDEQVQRNKKECIMNENGTSSADSAYEISIDGKCFELCRQSSQEVCPERNLTGHERKTTRTSVKSKSAG